VVTVPRPRQVGIDQDHWRLADPTSHSLSANLATARFWGVAAPSAGDRIPPCEADDLVQRYHEKVVGLSDAGRRHGKPVSAITPPATSASIP